MPTLRAAPRVACRVLSVVALAAALLAAAACAAQTGTSVSTTVTATAAITTQPTSTVMQSGWTVVHNLPAQTEHIAFAAASPQRAYLCAADGPAAPPMTATARLYGSADGGHTWRLIDNAPRLKTAANPIQGPQPLAVCTVFVDASAPADVFFQQTEFEPVGAGFAVVRALFRSEDGGTTWQTLSAPDRTDGFVALFVVGSRLIAEQRPSIYGASGCDPNVKPAPYSNVLESDDGGMSWHDAAPSIESQGYSPKSVSFAGGTLILAADQVPASQCQYQITSTLWRSTDGGVTWSRVSAPALQVYDTRLTPAAAGSGFYGVAWAISSGNASQVTPLYTSDSGATWRALPAFGPDIQHSGLIVTPGGAVLTDAQTTGKVSILWPDREASAWTVFAPDSGAAYGGQWQVVSGSAGATLWAESFTFGGSADVEYLQLP